MVLGSLLLLAAAGLAAPDPPEVRERFRQDDAPTHRIVVIRLQDGGPVRQDGIPEVGEIPVPAGETARILRALAGLEEGILADTRRVPCDSTCWAGGTHGEPDLAEALAFSCDTWFAAEAGAVPDDAVRRHARRLGFASGGTGPLATTAGEWAEFWRRVSRGTELHTRTSTTLLAAAGLAVSSPRGSARTLHAPTRTVRALSAASGDDGTWVSGTLRRRGGIQWAFCVHVTGASPALAVARAAHLLEETLRVREEGTRARGGTPLAPIDEEP